MKDFNLIISGVGGQGVLTLGAIIIQSALKEGYDIKQSELHGLSQRGGHVDIHIRLGENINSPLILSGKADLIIGLEPLESLRVSNYASKQNKTIILIDKYTIMPLLMSTKKEKYPSIDDIVKKLDQFSYKTIVVDASDIAKKEFGNVMMSNVYILGFICGAGMLPIKKEFLIQTIKETVKEKYIENNLKIFELGIKDSKK